MQAVYSYVTANNQGGGTRHSRRQRQKQAAAERLADEQNWTRVQTIHNGETAIVDTGPELRLDLGSHTLGVDAFYATASPYPLTIEGKLAPAVGLVNPPTYSAHVGFSQTQTRTINAGFSGEGGVRWYVKIPPQAATHGNSSGHFVNIYVRPQ